MITKWIPGLDSPHQQSSFGLFKPTFAPFSRSLLYPFTLGKIYEYLSISYGYLGYWPAIAKGITGLDSSHRGHLFEPLNVSFAPFLGLLSSILQVLVLVIAYRMDSLI